MKGLSLMTGGGLIAVVVDEAELFAGFGSISVAAIVAVLLINAPSASAQIAVVPNVTVATAPTEPIGGVTQLQPAAGESDCSRFPAAACLAIARIPLGPSRCC